MGTPGKRPPPLSVAVLKHVTPKAARYEISEGTVPGLRLLVHPSGVRVWVLRYKAGARTYKLTIGNLADVGLEAARKIATRHRGTIAAGGNPAEDKKAARLESTEPEKPAQTVRQAYDLYKAGHLEREHKASTRLMVEDIFDRFILPAIGYRLVGPPVGAPMPADASGYVSPHDIVALSAGSEARGHYNTANRIFVWVRAFYGWCNAKLVTAYNPTRGLKKPCPDNKRSRILSDDEIRRFWRACDEIGYPFGHALKLSLLTLARRGEIQMMARDELDLDGTKWAPPNMAPGDVPPATASGRWLLPEWRTKNGHAHLIHITPLARQIIESLPRMKSDRGWLFTLDGERPAANFAHAKTRLDKLMGDPPHWTIHDLRRTGASGLARLGVPIHITERILNHVSGTQGGIVGVYQLYEFEPERRDALERWSNYVARLVQ